MLTLAALMSLAMAEPCENDMGDCRRSRSLSIVIGSSRRSSFVPTRMMGVPGAAISLCQSNETEQHTVMLDFRPPLRRQLDPEAA